ncbi:hypothetical protein AAFF_G00340720 [Aldrovandia affinis]|uniref:Uncharacterized protein n=1 Tax=Aldrovandia affinis TaxID=143900 RepID=A0AAD7SKI0_9TELE|nr:hypothetical protein AAFF_G00340720 [Aldrovandia affinis]
MVSGTVCGLTAVEAGCSPVVKAVSTWAQKEEGIQSTQIQRNHPKRAPYRNRKQQQQRSHPHRHSNPCTAPAQRSSTPTQHHPEITQMTNTEVEDISKSCNTTTETDSTPDTDSDPLPSSNPGPIVTNTNTEPTPIITICDNPERRLNCLHALPTGEGGTSVHRKAHPRNLTVVLNVVHSEGRLAPSVMESLITLLFKGKGGEQELKNMRLINLLGANYKILAKDLAYRLQGTIPRSVGLDQGCWVPGRSPADNLVLIPDIFAPTQ